MYIGENNLDLHMKAEKKSCGLVQGYQSFLSLTALASSELSLLGSRVNKHPGSVWEVDFLVIPWTIQISASQLWFLGVPVAVSLSHSQFQLLEFQPHQKPLPIWMLLPIRLWLLSSDPASRFDGKTSR